MSDAPEDISEAIEQNALGPKRVQVGNESVEQHSIKDQIAADQHKANKAASGNPFMGMRFLRTIPPGAG